MEFSVVMPLYNKSYSIIRCIDSVLSQTYINFELIVVDDGSTDDSKYILKEQYFDEIAEGKIRLIEQKNKGVSAARNNGVQIAAHDYLCFLDADDEWLPDFLEQMRKLIADYPLADLYCLAHKVCKDDQYLFVPKHGLPSDHRGYVEDFFASSTKGSVAKSSKICVNKGSFLKIGGFPVGVVAGEDLYVWIRLALNGPVACDMSQSVIVHIGLDDSRSARKNSVPYPFVYFSDNKYLHKSSSLNKYLFSIFYKHFLKSIIDLEFGEAWLRISAYIKVYY